MNNMQPKPFRFWTQKVLPLVYDDSLSYYEVLNRVVAKLNQVIAYVSDDIDSLVTELVLSYFSRVTYNEETKTINLDLSKEENSNG